MFISCNTFANVDIFIIVRGKKSHGFTSFLPCPPYFPFIYKGETKGMEKGNNKDFYIFTGMNNTEFLRLPKVWENMTPSELMVYVVLRDMWQMMKNKEGFFFRSTRQLCDDCAMCDKTITKAIKGLTEKGHIKTYTNRTQYFTFTDEGNKYVMIPKLWDDLKPSELMVYVVLRDMWQMMKNKEGFFTSSYNEIAKRCKLSRKSVITIMNKLVFFGYVSTSEQTGNAPIYYTFQPAKWCKKYDGRGVKNTT